MLKLSFRSVLLVGWVVVLSGSEAGAVRPPERAPLPNLDRRVPGVVAARPGRAAAFAALQERAPGVRVEFHEVLGSPKSVASPHGFLSGPAEEGGRGKAVRPGDRHGATRAFLERHRALFGHGAEALDAARLRRDFTTAHNGLQTAVWQQWHRGRPVFGSALISHTTRRGELVSLSSQFVPDLAQAGARALAGRAPGAAPALSARQAVVLAARNLGEAVTLEETEAAGAAEETAEARQRFRAPALWGEAEASLAWLPLSGEEVRLCWDLVLTSRQRREMYRVLVDAQSEEVWLRHCLTDYLVPATYCVSTSDSPSPFSPGHPVPLTNQPPWVPPSWVTLAALDTNASPWGWINGADNGTGGNNARATWFWLESIDDDHDRQDMVYGQPFRVFGPGRDGNADPVVQMFYWCNWMHDRLYRLGFTEAAGNFQRENFGRGGAGGDAVDAVWYAPSAEGLSFGASMSTPPDGLAPSLWAFNFGQYPYGPICADAEVVLHEYTHGLTQRRVGGGLGLHTVQAGGMGEGWSDFYALALLSEAADDPDGNYALGAYSAYLWQPGFLQNYYFGLRRYPYTTDRARNPLTFKDIDPSQAGGYGTVPRNPVVGGTADEVHNMGEVWCLMLWEVRAALIKKHGFTAGHPLMLQLVTDALNLTPPDPDFAQARDALLQADWVNHGGANSGTLWAAFAKRGLGAGAVAPPSGTAYGVRESFQVPDSLSVHPAEGFKAAGPSGGPFAPRTQTFSLANFGTAPLAWAAGSSANWLRLSAEQGTLTPGATPEEITVSLSPAAELLPGSSAYFATVGFTNLGNGVVQTRQFVLWPGRRDYFTQQFQGDNDLDCQSLTFTPNGSADFYAACRQSVSAFPTDPAGGTALGMPRDSFVELRLAGSNTIALYGWRTNVFYLGSKGYVTLGRGDTAPLESLAAHFALPRISALFDDLEPDFSGKVSWKQLADRVAITFEHVPEYYAYNDNNFQFELFYDGVIRLSYLQVDAVDGLAGLSKGEGLPNLYTVSYLTDYGSCAPALTLEAPPSVTEGDGLLAGVGRVWLPGRCASEVRVELVSSDPAALGAPAVVRVEAGSLSAPFDLTVGDDGLLEGPQRVHLTASAPGFAAGSLSLLVQDTERASLSLELPDRLREGDGVVSGLVQLSAPAVGDLAVSLFSSDPTELEVPAYVIVLAGQTAASFNANVVDDWELDGPQAVRVTASVGSWTAGEAERVVEDNDPLRLAVSLPAQAMENQGLMASAGQVSLAGSLPTNLVVALVSEDPGEVTVPSSATILAGQLSARFDVQAVNDAEPDGMQAVTVNASAPGFAGGAASIQVYDDESSTPPCCSGPADLSANVSADTDLSWSATGSLSATSIYEVYFGTNPVPGAAEFQGSTTNRAWPLPRLEPGTLYHWQVVCRSPGLSPSPVWRFTTRGLDHFEWEPVGSPQFVAVPIPATIRAVDEFGRTVSNYAGSASLGGFSNQVTVLFADDFEQEGLVGWDWSPAEYTLAITNVAGSVGRSCLSVQGRTWDWDDGVSHVFWPDIALPAQTSFRLRASATNAEGGRLALSLSRDLFFSMGADGTMGVAYDRKRSPRLPYEALRWYKITLVLDWRVPRWLSFFVDDQLVAGDIDWGWGPYDGPHCCPEWLSLENKDQTQVWFDDLRLLSAPLAVAVPLQPSAPIPFTNGSWSGAIVVGQPVQELYLTVDDGLRHGTTNSPLAVGYRDDLSLTVSNWPSVASLGSNLTYTLLVKNSGPSGSSGVRLTNLLAPTVTLLSVTAPGPHFLEHGNQLVLDLGTLAGGECVRVELVVRPEQSLPATNWTRLRRFEPEMSLANNVALAVTPVYPSVSVLDTMVAEGNLGTLEAVFPVVLSGPSSQTVTVAYETADGSAAFGTDYVFQEGLVVFPPGMVSNSIRVLVCGDVAPEPDQTFQVVLTSSTLGAFPARHGTGTIRDDDRVAGRLASLQWGPVASVQSEHLPFPASLLAWDAAGLPLASDPSSVRLAARAEAPAASLVTLGGGDRTEPLRRVQMIVPAAQFGGPGRLTALDLNLAAPGNSDWVIRMKHTPLASYASPIWESRGWTVVCQASLSFPPAGWVTLALSTPFEYNGTQSLMVDLYMTDLSIQPPSCFVGATATAQTLWSWMAESSLRSEDPLAWNGRIPVTGLWPYVPDLRLSMVRYESLPTEPAQAGEFLDGVWHGEIALLGSGTNLVLVADDGNGHQAVSSTFTVVPSSDDNGDGLPDQWQILYFGSATAPGAGPNDDPDGDGLSNREEFLAGTHPLAASSSLRVLSVSWSAGEVGLSFATVAGKHYQLEQAARILHPEWQSVGPIVTGAGEVQSVTLPAALPQPATFYRVRLVP